MAEASIYEIHDPRFRQMIVTSAGLDELYSGCRWAEGPVWFNDANQLLWSDIPNQRMLRWTPEGGVSVYRQPSNFANGHTRDRQGRLISCEHGRRRVTRTEIDGSITVLADRFEGAPLNSPNDVVVKSDGTIWFTDPTYGIMSDYEAIAPSRSRRPATSIGSIRRPVSCRRSSMTLSSRTASPSRLMKRSSTSRIRRQATTKTCRATSAPSTSSTATSSIMAASSAISTTAFLMASEPT